MPLSSILFFQVLGLLPSLGPASGCGANVEDDRLPQPQAGQRKMIDLPASHHVP